jgi:hypothetical protein
MLTASVVCLGLTVGVVALGQKNEPPDAGPPASPLTLPADPGPNGPPPSNLPPAELPQAGPADDPMQAVEAFVERSRKEADDSIKALTREAETLRARLQKVEAALERWKGVAEGLKQEPRRAAVELPPQPVAADALKEEPRRADVEPPRQPVEGPARTIAPAPFGGEQKK